MRSSPIKITLKKKNKNMRIVVFSFVLLNPASKKLFKSLLDVCVTVCDRPQCTLLGR